MIFVTTQHILTLIAVLLVCFILYKTTRDDSPTRFYDDIRTIARMKNKEDKK